MKQSDIDTLLEAYLRITNGASGATLPDCCSDDSEQAQLHPQKDDFTSQPVGERFVCTIDQYDPFSLDFDSLPDHIRAVMPSQDPDDLRLWLTPFHPSHTQLVFEDLDGDGVAEPYLCDINCGPQPDGFWEFFNSFTRTDNAAIMGDDGNDADVIFLSSEEHT